MLVLNQKTIQNLQKGTEKSVASIKKQQKLNLNEIYKRLDTLVNVYISNGFLDDLRSDLKNHSKSNEIINRLVLLSESQLTSFLIQLHKLDYFKLCGFISHKRTNSVSKLIELISLLCTTKHNSEKVLKVERITDTPFTRVFGISYLRDYRPQKYEISARFNWYEINEILDLYK